MKYIELIEKYLENEMSADERIAFEQSCENNSELAEEFAFYINTQQAFRQEKHNQFNERYHSISKNETRTRTIRRYISIAASAAVIVFILWIGNSYLIIEPKDKLTEIHTPIRFPNSRITRDATDTSLIDQALELSWIDSFNQALVLIDTLEDKTALSIKGYCNLRLNNLEAAKSNYEDYLKLEKQESERWFATWNLILVYRGLGNTEKATELLDNISEEGQEHLIKNIKD